MEHGGEDPFCHKEVVLEVGEKKLGGVVGEWHEGGE